jgi:hypothetical protein
MHPIDGRAVCCIPTTRLCLLVCICLFVFVCLSVLLFMLLACLCASSLRQNVKFLVTVLLPRPFGDNVTRATMDAATQVVKLPPSRDLNATRNLMQALGIDVLIAADDGLDPFIYSMLHSRLAPVQVAMHPTIFSAVVSAVSRVIRASGVVYT